MRILLAAWDNGGGVEVVETVVRKCVGAGHEVRVLGTEGLRERMEGAGALFRRYRYAPDNDRRQAETDLIKDWEAKNPLDSFGRIRDRVMFGPASLFCRDVAEELAAETADVVIVDVMIASALCAAEAAGIPRVLLVHALYGIPRVGATPMGVGFLPAAKAAERLRDRAVSGITTGLLRPGLAPLNAARAELGLYRYETVLELFDVVDRIVVCTSPSYDFDAGAAPGNLVYVGPQSDDAAGETWESPWPEDPPRPLVLVTLSSTFMEQGGLLQDAVDALGRLPVHGLVTTGPTVDPSSLRTPPNVVVRSWVPHAAVLPHCAAVLTHGGHGTVMKALAAGVPMVVVALGRDQPDNAARVVHADAGVRVTKRPDAARLEEAVRQVLDQPQYAAGARAMAARLADERDDALVVKEIEAAAAGAPPLYVRRRARHPVAAPVGPVDADAGSPLLMPEGLEHHSIGVSDGGTIEVVVREGSGPTIVLLHGLGMAADIWVKQFAGLHADHRLVAWDQRGYGGSKMGDGGVGIDRFVEDLVSVLEALDVRHCLLVGHSLGGMIALEAAITERERLGGRVSGLVLASTTGGTVPAIGSGKAKSAAFGAVFAVVRRFDFSHLPGLVPLGVRLSFGAERPRDEDRQLVRRLMLATSSETPELMELLATYDTSGRLEAVELPVVVTAGTRDNFMPIAHVKRLAAKLPSAEFVPFERAGHLLMLERPAEFNALVERAAATSCAGSERRASHE
jgi:MGT family glycosyltransferase